MKTTEPDPTSTKMTRGELSDYDLETLNHDAIYAAMVFLREYAESPEGLADYRDLLERKAGKADFFDSLVEGTGVVVYKRPTFNLSDEKIEEIYSDEPASVRVGIEVGRTVIWGAPGVASVLLQSKDSEHDPIAIALSRFIADRAN